VSVERERVKQLVRAELEKRLASAPSSRLHPALLEIVVSELCVEDDTQPPPPCIIEPDRPCYNSGYCKRLGY
jgi:hypothetical protein